MALNLYRRHENACAGGHPNRSQTYQTDELRRGWKKCFCVIQVAGTLAGRFHRKSTGVRTWEQAQALSVQWEHLGTWQKVLGEAVISEPAPLPQTAEETAPPITLVRAIQAYLDRKSTRLNSSHANISYAVFCLKKKKKNQQ